MKLFTISCKCRFWLLAVIVLNTFIFSSLAYSNERPEIFVQLGHSSVVSSVAFSPDGSYAITGGLDTTMKLWDVATGRELRTFAGHADRVDAVAFSPNGRYAISGHYMGRMKLWDVVTGMELRTFSERSDKVSSVAFSPAGQHIISGGWDKTLKLWDVATGRELLTFAGHSARVMSVAFSPDGRYALSGSADKTMKLWDVTTGRELRTFAGHSNEVSSVAFSPDGRHILSGGWDKTMKLWDVSTGRELRTLIGHSYKVSSVAFSPDGRYILSGSWDETLKLWNVATGRELRTFDGRSGLLVSIVNSVAFSPDGRYILSGGNDKAPKLWNVSTGRILRTFAGRSSGISTVAFSPDGRYILSGGIWDTTLKLRDMATGRELHTFAGRSSYVSTAVFSPDGRYILTGAGDKTVKLWDVAMGRVLRTFVGHSAQASSESSVAFSPDGRYIISGGNWDKYIKLWDMATGRELHTFAGHSNQVFSVTFSPDGRYILSGSADKTLKLWDVETGRELRTFAGHSKWVMSVAFSPDGRYALSGSADKTMKLWDVETGRELRTFAGYSSWLKSVFSPDGRYILSGSADKTLKLWEVATGRVLRTFVGHSATVNSVAFSPDGRYIISGSSDQTTRLWDVSNGTEITSMVSFDDGEWITITPEGYYNSSLNGHKNLNIRMGMNVYSIDQFYDVFYRPDIVTAKLKGEDIGGLITITIADALRNPPPAVEFTSFPSDTDKSGAIVCYQVKNQGGGIGEVRLFHDGKLVRSDGFYRDIAKTAYGKMQLASHDGMAIRKEMRGVTIQAKTAPSPITSKSKGDSYSDCTEVDTVSGENELSLTAFNGENTIQSPMKTVSFKSSVRQEDPHLYILIIGIDRYMDHNIDLKYAAKDASDVRDKLFGQSKTLYKLENIHEELFVNKEATRENILGKISSLAKMIKPVDSFVLFVAGHGVLIQDQYYILTHDYDGTVSNRTMISSNEIVEASKRIKSLSQLLIFDTCHAGGIDYIVSGLYDARMSVLAKKMGLHIYASANSMQSAIDGYKGNGLFTYTLLDGLNNNKGADKNKDGKVSIVGLGEYSKKMTTNISKQIGHEQTPLIINFGKDSPIYKLQ